MGEGRVKREDGPASGRGPPGHAGSAAHAQARRAERGPGEDPEGEPPAEGATPRAPPLAFFYFAQAVATELPPSPPTDASQQQQPQAEALHCGTYLVGPCLPCFCIFLYLFMAFYQSWKKERLFVRFVKQFLCVRSFVLFVVSFGNVSIRFLPITCWVLRHFE